MLNAEVLSGISKLVTKVAAIDKWRFNNLSNRDYSSRDQIVIEEIAPKDPQDALTQFLSREGEVDKTRKGAAETSVNDALKFRAERIDSATSNPKIKYTLYWNQPNEEKNGKFIEVAKKVDGKLKVSEGQDELFKKLTTLVQTS